MRAKFIRNILVVFFSLGIINSSRAQDASRIFIEPMGWSIGANIGMTDLWGNVGTQSVIEHYINSKAFDQVCFMGGLLGRYTIHPCLAVRGQLNMGLFYANDDWNIDLAKAAATQGDDAYQRYSRKQKSEAWVFEGTLMFEYTPFRTNPESKMAHRRGQFFLGVGLGGFYFEPYSTVGTSNTWVKTYDLHLEGQGWGAGYPADYSRWQPCIPLVVGYRWDLGLHLNLGIEWMYRYTFTGYIDGVSNNYIDPSAFAAHLSPHDAQLALQIYDKSYMYGLSGPNIPGTFRGTPSVNDAYSTITITFYYKVKNKIREWWH